MFYVYAIINNKGKIYIGQTVNLEARLKRHNGLLYHETTAYTYKNKEGEWRMIYKEELDTRSEALRREKELKSFRGREYIKSIINK